MEQYDVIWANVANNDLIEIIQYLHMDNPIAAKNVFEKIKTATSQLNSFPDRGRIVPEIQQQGILKYRELVVSPWRVIYRVSKPHAYILSVIDSRRNVEDILLNRFTRNIVC